MIVTELEKAWYRKATAKLIRCGKLSREPCAVCGAKETFVHHIDYSDPERIEWLCKGHLQEKSLSALQRELLKRGLLAYYNRPIRRALRLDNPGCFQLRSMMEAVADRRERASRRAAAGLAIARLIRRGLLECCSRGHWRLTRRGLLLPSGFTPSSSPSQNGEVEHNVLLHQAVRQHIRPRRRRKKLEGSRRAPCLWG
jgi:hypothetical protein